MRCFENLAMDFVSFPRPAVSEFLSGIIRIFMDEDEWYLKNPVDKTPRAQNFFLAKKVSWVGIHVIVTECKTMIIPVFDILEYAFFMTLTF